jgi:hypothetical protein
MINPFVLFAWYLIASLPILVIAVVGVMLSRSKIPREHTKARRHAICGFSLLGVQTLVGAAMHAYEIAVTFSTGDRIAMTRFASNTGFVTSILLVASLVLLLLAVLADRQDPHVAPSNNSLQRP